MKDDYLKARQGNLKTSSFEASTHHLNRLWKPLHRLPVTSIDRGAVAARLRTIATENGPVAADRARSTLSKMFAWAIGEGLCESNPVMGTNKQSEAKARERTLADHELVTIWNAVPGNDYGHIVRLLMLTAQRRDEIGGLRRTEVDTAGKLIVLPGERTKNGRAHEIPLSALALTELDSVTEREGSALVFGKGAGGYSGWSKSKAALDESCKLEPWTLHDLRRTAATRMADLGVLPHVIEAVLNHVSGHKAGVAGIYNRSTYAAEKRAALDLWASHVRTIVAQAAGANVTKIRAKRA